MAHYYPLYTGPQASSPGASYGPVNVLWRYVVQPVSRREPDDDLCKLIGIDDKWLPKKDHQRSGDPAEAILGEKADLGKMTVGTITYQIVQRERIKDDNLKRILYQEVAVDSQIFRLQGVWPDDPTWENSRLKSGLEMELLRLEQQKRAEEVECWRDISRLKDKLLDRLIEYRDAARRFEMVGSGLAEYAGTGGVYSNGDR